MEAFCVARQFNLVPPLCDQLEYHMFHRHATETQMPELYHKIGKRQFKHCSSPSLVGKKIIDPRHCYFSFMGTDNAKDQTSVNNELFFAYDLKMPDDLS